MPTQAPKKPFSGVSAAPQTTGSSLQTATGSATKSTSGAAASGAASNFNAGSSSGTNAKPSAFSTGKATQAAYSTAETTRNAAESMLKVGTDTAKEFFASGTEEAQKAHDKFFAIGREGTENLSRAVDAMTKTLTDLAGIARENADAAVEVNHITADIAKSINSELVSCANSNFSDNIELCKEMFACRDINDAIELQSKWISTNVENFFSQSTRLAEMLFQLATEAAEPINERLAEATERFSKTMAAAA